jgi:transcriptional regulator with XRE-family HTH domain
MASSSALAKNLRRLRLAANLKREDVSNFLKLKIKTYDAYEHGRAEPNISNFLKLAELFKCSPGELLSGKPKPNLDESLIKISQIQCIINGQKETVPETEVDSINVTG